MGKSLFIFLASASVALSSLASVAIAGSPLSVLIDRSQLMMLSDEPSTIIVGNPSIADVSLNGRQLFIHGHSAGETNLMVFNQDGTKIVDLELSVIQDGSNSVTVFAGSSNSYRGTVRRSYVCAPNCDPSMVASDDSTSLGNAISNNRNKDSFTQAFGNRDSGAGARKASTW